MEETAKKELKASTANLSSFAGYTNRTEGQEQRGGVVGIVKYNEPHWLHDGVELPPDGEYIVTGVDRYVIKWPAEDRSLAPYRELIPDGQPFPDVERLNKEEPKENWIEASDGKKKGPWALERQVHMLNRALDKFTYVTSTTGGGICVDQLVDKVNAMQAYYGNPCINPVVKLTNTHMRSKYNPRGLQRPHMIPLRWVIFGDGGAMKPIEPPSAKDVTGDEIKF